MKDGRFVLSGVVARDIWLKYYVTAGKSVSDKVRCPADSLCTGSVACYEETI
jgi:hypothetical protein